MKAILKKLERKERITKTGKKFSVIEYTCDVEFANGDVKTLKGSMSLDYAKRYFDFCNISSKEAINNDVSVVVAKRKYTDSNDNERTVTYIKYMNFIDEQGNKLIMKSEDSEDLDF